MGNVCVRGLSIRNAFAYASSTCIENTYVGNVFLAKGTYIDSDCIKSVYAGIVWIRSTYIRGIGVRSTYASGIWMKNIYNRDAFNESICISDFGVIRRSEIHLQLS